MPAYFPLSLMTHCPILIQRAGRIALLGQPNVGKSTLFNALMEFPLAITSRCPQTTRDSLIRIREWKDAQLVLVDTPRVHQSKTKLGDWMNCTAKSISNVQMSFY
ncbi:GTPase [Pajaroellobacter abortibovis]|uniref:G domain-containing protein n=1 Tax=Pajaroellobacter abortibovis TaxID=1882918 RepID=A0A1L6MXY6_9BACT|nr:GTPase [Pajaroellobacter abortibovis]APS00307.1 hypothetical protein BCY86_06140 [Pajaroellobacter abortibovis]